MLPAILGLIPARAGSQGVPGKHMKLLGGKPLIRYTFDSALRANWLHTIALSTDCPDIIEYAKGFPAIEIPFLRPSQLAAHDTPSVEVIQHAMTFYKNLGRHFDYICLLQATTPFRPNGLIDYAIQLLLDNKAESLVSIHRTPNRYNPYGSLRMDSKNRVTQVIPGKVIPRRQDLPEAFHRDGQIYLTSVHMIERGEIMNPDTMGLLDEQGPDINIDTLEDWKLAENWLADER